MAWKDVARIASDWAEAKKTELLTADRRTREDAGVRADHAERRAQEEAGTTALEAVLPPSLARHVTDNRPEVRAARKDAERRARLAGQATAHVAVVLTGEEQGTAEAVLPLERSVDEADPEYPGSTPWLRVLAESPDLVPMGTTSLGAVSLAFPGFTGPGAYDLRHLHALGESGAIEQWDPFDIWVCPDLEHGDTTWFWDSGEPGLVEVSEVDLTFQLTMVSAVSRVHAAGRITWG